MISHVVYDSTETALATGIVALVIGWFWFAAPVVRSLRDAD
jgi:hypothetical protein